MKLNLDRYVPGLLLWLSNKMASSASSLYRTHFDLGVADWRGDALYHRSFVYDAPRAHAHTVP